MRNRSPLIFLSLIGHGNTQRLDQPWQLTGPKIPGTGDIVITERAPYIYVRETCTTETRSDGLVVIAGTTYSGEQNNITVTGKSCISWAAGEGKIINATNPQFAPKGIGEHNYCRSPDDDNAWCYTDETDNDKWEYCTCPKMPLNPTAPPQCCDSVTLTGLKQSVYDGTYSKANSSATSYRLLNDRTLYVHSDGQKAIWHFGNSGSDAFWVIGPAMNIENSFNHNNGWGFANEDTACPSDAISWKEYDMSDQTWADMTVPMACDAWTTNCVSSYGWSDKDADTCSQYKDNGYCTADGKQGSAWGKGWGDFSAFTNLAKDANNCPECGCTEPLWGDWAAWTTCSTTCAAGTHERSRSFTGGCTGKYCTPPSGDDKESENCNEDLPCPSWAEWAAWGSCSVTCAGGTQSTTRECTNGTPGDVGCDGIASNTQACEQQECPTWNDWTEWSACTATCGDGTQDRSRTCNHGSAGDVGCDGSATGQQQCVTGKPCGSFNLLLALKVNNADANNELAGIALGAIFRLDDSNRAKFPKINQMAQAMLSVVLQLFNNLANKYNVKTRLTIVTKILIAKASFFRGRRSDDDEPVVKIVFETTIEVDEPPSDVIAVGNQMKTDLATDVNQAILDEQIPFVDSSGDCKNDPSQCASTLEVARTDDIDECGQGNYTCPTGQECVNQMTDTDNPDGYTCACLDGWNVTESLEEYGSYNKTVKKCEDIDECTDGTNKCDMDASCANSEGSYECECNSGLTGDGFSCRICPSDACWSYNATEQTCTVKSDCTTVNCGSTTMAITFDSRVFNIDEENVDQIVWSSEATPTFKGKGQGFHVELTHGTGGMSYTINEENKLITLKVFISISGDKRKRSMSESGHKRIDLGAIDVMTTPFGVGVLYECTYPMYINVTSSAYEIHHVSHFGANIGYGDLAGAFEMTLTGEGAMAERAVMGTLMFVTVEWIIKSFTELTFYYDKCTVTHGTVNVDVIKDGCYAKVTETRPLSQMSSVNAFSYRVFKGFGQDDTQQRVACSLILCRKDNCQIPKSNAQCPNSSADTVMKFSFNGL